MGNNLHRDTPQDQHVLLENREPFYYVGIGASAGGLEALELFFTHMPADSGLTFIVIQHLSPDYKSLMVELLSKRTQMRVRRAEEGMLVEANNVYLIPPKKNLSIFHGKLLLSEQDFNRGINLPIDVFFRTLAEDQGEKAVGIILSGTGSDGVRGIRAIKETGGMIMVQSEESARFDGMPRAAISTGLADFILPPEDMPQRLLSFVNHPYVNRGDGPPPLLSDEDGMTRIFSLLRERTKVDFTFYKPSTVVRRIERRMTVNQVPDLRDYVRLMETHPGEVTTLYRELLIGVTSFFRDREVFEELENVYLPEALDKINGRQVRFWVAGCSTGEEAYTLAILTRECLEKISKSLEIKIFATDIDRNAIVRAGNGNYPESIAADLPPGLLSKYFHRRQDSFQIDRSIREMVVFAQHNLIKDPPFTKIDLVSCRNLLIYLQPVLQRKALEYINFSLNPQGILLLGTSETTGDMSEYFDSLHHKYKIYRSRGKRSIAADDPDFHRVTNLRPWQQHARYGGGRPGLARQDDERLLDRFLQSLAGDYVPLAAIVNEEMEVMHILGDPEGLLTLPTGKLVNDITKMASKDLAIPLATGLQKIFKTGEEIKYTNIRLRHREGSRNLQMRLKPLPGRKGQEPLAAVFFSEIVATTRGEHAPGEEQVYDLTREAEQRINDLEQELQFTRENLQATIEELETANEELQATNEELLASNEELQSTNEELQSVNEELHTVNAEYQTKIIELTELNNDLDNLLASTRIGTLFLDENLEIRRFTPEIRQLFRVLDNDIGRPVHHLTHKIVDIDPIEIIQEVEREAAPRELEIRTREGAWFLMRILPYHVGANTISGLVITFIDIGPLKKAQSALADNFAKLSSLLAAAPVGIGLTIDRVFKEVSDRLCQMLGYRREELLGKSARMTYVSWDEFQKVGDEKYRQVKKQGLGTIETTWKRKDGSTFPVLINSAPLDSSDLSQGLTFTVLDMTHRRQAEDESKLNEARLQSLFNISQYPAGDMQDLLDYALEEAVQLTRSQLGFLYQYDEMQRALTLHSWSKGVMEECDIQDIPKSFCLDKAGIWGEGVRRGKPLLMNDYPAAHPLKKGYPPGHLELKRLLVVPVLSGGKVVATAGVANKEKPYDETDSRQLSLHLDSVWNIVENKKNIAELLELQELIDTYRGKK